MPAPRPPPPRRPPRRAPPPAAAPEAVRQLVDDAYLAGLPEVEIVHGRGTGAVRSAVREELDRHPLVERHASESADGATRVTLASRSAD